MYKDFMPEMSRVRREEYAAEYRPYAKVRDLARRSVRARWARRLFAAAFALEAEESWRAVWDRMSAGPEAGLLGKGPVRPVRRSGPGRQ
ncbi:Hypothetical Protein RradSPS_2406 [Rubrobacter radiotolerans]|uniref:Uncharacterized protein n=1 Tax=Rubrobacter radiotolerans TaxID=42256 RepID=A0A023X6J6_RUBRA|nr:hypothetical protein [Rubrobacter radiotolerans]AHY47689.1 Hypothetical Protein RradSPS_2406 [Rubrobacter radiotolerans]MDX5895092.1 hypothetical protein [Rubrobacter radiotolerans]SMC07438.1 conserved hypothetical protein [Rubrobacter radiotolerans DSM 5868]